MTTDFAARVHPFGEFSADTVSSMLASAGATVEAKHGVRAAALGYATHDVLARPSRASGLIAVPLDVGGARDVVVWLHGTSVNRNDVPSHPADLTSKLLAALFASAGFVFVAPDYLGLGVEGEGPHPYLHARSEASASQDMRRAMRDVAPDALGGTATRRLFLTGFSQGGHAALALQRDLEAAAESPFDVAACAPVAGPYNLSAVTVPVVYGRPGVNTCGYLGYLLTAYRVRYGIYDAPDEVFVEPYDRIAPPLFDGLHTADEVTQALPFEPPDFIRRDWWDAAIGDPAHAFAAALRENDVDGYAPRAPTRLYVGTADEDVPPENAPEAVRSFRDRGSSSVEVIDLGPLDHEATAYAAFPRIRAWFEELSAADA
jgi:S-formylglutathione hydrolase FrmB